MVSGTKPAMGRLWGIKLTEGPREVGSGSQQGRAAGPGRPAASVRSRDFTIICVKMFRVLQQGKDMM